MRDAQELSSKTGKLILQIYLIFLISGCSLVPNYYEADPIFKQQSNLLKDDDDGYVIQVDSEKLKNRADEANDYLLRNQLLEELLTISDRSCSRHHATIIANVNTWNIATGTTSTLLSAIATVTGGATTKAALSAGAALTNSTQSLVNEEIYAQAIGPTIVRSTISSRQKKLAEIEEGMREKDLGVYSVQHGLRDIYNYHSRCSFYYGLLEITQAIDERRRSRSEIMNALDLLKSEAKDALANKRSVEKLNTRIEELSLELENAPN